MKLLWPNLWPGEFSTEPMMMTTMTNTRRTIHDCTHSLAFMPNELMTDNEEGLY